VTTKKRELVCLNDTHYDNSIGSGCAESSLQQSQRHVGYGANNQGENDEQNEGENDSVEN